MDTLTDLESADKKNRWLEARVKELEQALDLYKVKDDQVQSALARLKEILADPPWEKV